MDYRLQSRSILLGIVFTMIPALSWSLGLGDIEVKSAFNKRFTAVIPVLLGKDEKDVKVEVGRKSDYELMQLPRPGLIDKLELAIAPNPKKPSERIIIISSPVPIHKPSFNLIIRASAGGGTVLENYFLAVDFRKSLTLELPKKEKIKKEVAGLPELKQEEIKPPEPKKPEFKPSVVKKERLPAGTGRLTRAIPKPLETAEPIKKTPAPVIVEKIVEPVTKPPIVVEKIIEPVTEPLIVVEKIEEPVTAEPIVVEKTDEVLPPVTEPEKTEVPRAEFIKVSPYPAKNRHKVQKRESLYLIAKKLGVKQKDLAKVAVAIYLENRAAFIGGNIHMLRADAKLDYDKVNETASRLTGFDSSALVARHEALLKTRYRKAPIPIETPLDSQASAQDIYAFLEVWKQRWMAKDIDALADSYADGFRDRRGRGKSDFIKARKNFNKNHVNIRLIFENINIVRSGPLITLYFTQWFKSDNYASVGLKHMSLIPTTKGLKIRYEEFSPKRASSGRHAWTVFLASYQGMATTRSRVERLRSLGFRAFEASSYRTDGIKWYRLMVGRLSDRRQAANLANRLKEAGEPFIKVLKLPFALEVSSYDSHDTAIGEVKKLREAGLSPYIIETVNKDGEARYTVYLGAFTRIEEARNSLSRLADAKPDLRITTP